MKSKPIFRIFDYNKAMEFYIEWLGFKILAEHKFGENFPLYVMISLNDLEIHLSEHHGDCSPGAHTLIEGFKNLTEYHQNLLKKDYKYNKPGLKKAFWDESVIVMEVIDPFGNRLTFTEKISG